MRLLLDTHIFLWSTEESDRITRFDTTLNDPENEIFVSIATIWEIAIKQKSGKLGLSEHAVDWIAKRRELAGFKTLPILDRHIWTTMELPLHHRDPFDRLILAQAISEEMTLLTNDRKMRQYDAPLLWADQ